MKYRRGNSLFLLNDLQYNIIMLYCIQERCDEMRVDTILKNGITVEGSPIEIAIDNGKIIAVHASLEGYSGEVIDLEGSYISAGWIDDHVHCNELMNVYFDSPDTVGVETGVCTVIDAGSSGADNIQEFYEKIADAKTNVYALINISKTGIVRQDELSDLENIDATLVKDRVADMSHFIVGLKARMSQSVVGKNGIIPLVKAKEIQKDNHDLPLMVHIGSAPPNLREICELLEKGDIVTHCFNGKQNNILDEDGKIYDFVLDAKKRGVLFDIGHGSASFSFDVAKKAFNQCFYCDTVSTDIYNKNRQHGPVYNLSTTLDKLLHLGYSLETLIPMITKTPAEFFRLDSKGNIEVGFDADFTIFDVLEEEHVLVDSEGKELNAQHKVTPRICIVGGNVYRIGENI